MHLDDAFPRYMHFNSHVPIWCITHDLKGCIHRFYDTSPFSPSGRYLAVTRFPREDRLPSPGDRAQVVVVDLLEGSSSIVAETCGWDTQLGSQAQWGEDDNHLLFNDLDTVDWKPYGVLLDLKSGTKRRLEGTVYMASPDGQHVASPCLLRMSRTQPGYGVIAPEQYVPRNIGFPADDGLYVTNVDTGKSRLVVSFAEIAAQTTPPLDTADLSHGEVYGFHVKWNPQGDRLMFVMRQKVAGEKKARSSVITMGPDGSDIRLALHWRLWRGHHPNWCPDGKNIIMNLKDASKILRFVTFRSDGGKLHPLAGSVRGSGHPTLHPRSGHILTDAKPKDALASEAGKVPLRWIDTVSGYEQVIAEITTPPDRPLARALRVDLHPAWDRSYTMIAFNAAPAGTRRVYVADMSTLLDQPFVRNKEVH